MSDLVQIRNLRDYTKCPNFSKYNWSRDEQSPDNPIRNIIKSCLRDAAVLEKRTDWKAIRSRVYREIFKNEETNKTTDALYKQSVEILETIRSWYLKFYRDEPGSVLCNLPIQQEIQKRLVTAIIDAVLVHDNRVTLIEFTDLETPELILKDIGIRTKVYLLGKEKILVNRIWAINVKENKVNCMSINVYNPEEWNYKTLQALNLILTSVNQKIFYPSVTSMCTKCRYKSICSW